MRRASACSARRRASRVGLDELLEIACRRSRRRRRASLDDVGDAEERQPPVEEGGDRDLVGRVERARGGAAALAGLARQREQRERLQVGRLEVERRPAARSSGGTGVARAPGR